eukprot:Skav206820  [mRNA]  locus=scaffold4354:99715:103264:+ [translate_table: standard]
MALVSAPGLQIAGGCHCHPRALRGSSSGTSCSSSVTKWSSLAGVTASLVAWRSCKARLEFKANRATKSVSIPGKLRSSWMPSEREKREREKAKSGEEEEFCESIGALQFELVGGPEDLDSTDVLLRLGQRSLGNPGKLWSCFLPSNDVKTGFAELSRSIELWLNRKGPQRVILLGEGFGGLLALSLALRFGRSLKGLAMINPATGFVQQPWSQLRSGLPVAPLSDLLMAMPSEGSSEGFGPDLIARGITGSLGLRSASAAASDGTLKFRLKAWLRDGWEAVSSELRRPADRNPLPATLLAFSNGDLLLPSKDEAQALKPILEERCLSDRLEIKELESTSHEPAGDIDFVELLNMSPILKAPRDPVADFEFPSLEALEEGSKDVEQLAALVSPIFCSFNADSPSQRRFGLQGVPALHGPGEDYQLFWPSKTDFVRVAARFDAVVVPFGGIGADDSAQAC